MKKNELMNGDIVVLRSGSVAVVIGEGADACLMYQYGGIEALDEYYDDDLCDEIDDDKVMQVFRPEGGFGFEGVDREYPIWERDEAWACPAEQEREERHHVAVERNAAECEAAAERMAEARKDVIGIVAQAFYGNRTSTEIRRENIDRFILGYLSDEIPVTEPVDRTVIRLPGSENLVLVYNKHQEAERLENKEWAFRERNYTIKPLATIPEMGLEIYSRCIVCRMGADGAFESLLDGDYEIWGRYLAN